MNRGAWLGFIFFVGLVLLGFGTLLIGNIKIFARPTTIRVNFDKVEGLRSGDDVRVDGVLLGKVHSLELASGGVDVILSLDERITLYQEADGKPRYTISVESFTVLGGNFVNIRRGEPGPFVVDSNRTLIGRAKASGLDEVGTVVQENRANIQRTLANLEDITTTVREKGPGTLEALKSSVEEIKATFAKLNRAEGTLGKLLSMDEIYKDVREAAATIKGIVERVAQGEGNLGRFLKDDKLYTDLTFLTEQLKSKESTLGRLFTDKELSDDFGEAIKNFKETTHSLKSVAKKVDESEGLFKAFIQDEKLREEVQRGLQGLDESLGRAARSTVSMGSDTLVFGIAEASVTRFYVRFAPPADSPEDLPPGEYWDKYIRAGFAMLSYDKDSGKIRFEDQVEERDDQTFFKPEIELYYRIPKSWFFGGHIGMHAGLIEGQPGGGMDIDWSDWGAFEYPVKFIFEGRRAYDDFDDDKIDEDLDGAYFRTYARFSLWPYDSTIWWRGILHKLKLYVGADRLWSDPQFFAAAGFEFADRDLKTLVALIGSAR